MQIDAIDYSSLDETLAAHRARLVRLCARLSGNPEAAEDLAQETLITAWQQIHALRRADALPAWLSGIARNLCLRWRRSTARDGARLPTAPAEQADAYSAGEAFDLELELERHELADLLDRALTLLPADTRAALIQRYVAGSPHAEIAARLRLSEGAVAMRLQRGRLALRRILSTALRDEARAYGLADTEAWNETRLWCPQCGQQRLVGSLVDGTFALRCTTCCDHPSFYTVRRANHDGLLSGVAGYRRALARTMAWSHSYFAGAIAEHGAPCLKCGRPTRVRLLLPGALAERENLLGVDLSCEACGTSSNQSLHALALSTPAGRHFWREHPRMRSLPLRETRVAGAPALAIGFENVSANASFELLVLADTHRMV